MNRNYFKNSLKELNDAKRILKEAYDAMDDGSQDPRMAQQDPRMMQQQQNMQGQPMGEDEEEQPIQDPQMDDVISQIRELSIKGIAQYADQVESEQYQSLKRIWLETDKFYEAMNPDKDKK